MTVVLFTAAGPQTGLGHLSRCDALAQALRARNIRSLLVVASDAGQSWVAQRPPDTDWVVAPWLSDASVVRQFSRNADIVIFDAYDINADVVSVIRSTVRSPVFFDDLGYAIPDTGTIINGSPGANGLPYPRRPGLRLLLGLDYQVLRTPFRDLPSGAARRKLANVGIMLGGTDHRGLMPDLVSLVLRETGSLVRVHAIGPMKVPLNDSRIVTTGQLSARDVRRLFDRLDLLVTAAGQSVAEAVASALPAVIFQTASNQKLAIAGWHATGAVEIGGSADDRNWSSLVADAVRRAVSHEARDRMRANAIDLGLHQSTTNVVEAIIGNSELC